MNDEVLAVAQDLLRKGLVEGTSGNVSARLDDSTVCITPSSVPYETMTLADLVVIDMDDNVVSGERYPSSERALHLAIYHAFPEIRSVIHAHPIHATMFAVARQPIPAVIDEFAIYVGGDVPVCDYAQSGTPQVGDVAVAQLKDVGAALLANHGMVAIGTDPRKALQITALVERSARIIWGARMLGDLSRVPDEVNTNFASVYTWVRNNPPASA
ncbi:MAG: class II aldolase/adducin family protein [Actinobacteria bacterium]|nr:class II aldolase/adducin family protein [Actinomycetota bacterium]